jgi:hypothetical protein
MARIRLQNNAAPESAAPIGQLSIYSKLDLGLYIQGEDAVEKRLIDTSCPGASGYIAEYFTLTLGNIVSKEVTLTNVPAYPSYVLLQIDGAAPSFYSLDYTVSGSALSWNGLRLDGLLEPGDVLQVIYFV